MKFILISILALAFGQLTAARKVSDPFLNKLLVLYGEIKNNNNVNPDLLEELAHLAPAGNGNPLVPATNFHESVNRQYLDGLIKVKAAVDDNDFDNLDADSFRNLHAEYYLAKAGH